VIRHLHDDLDRDLLEEFHRTVLTPSFSEDELETSEELLCGLLRERPGDTLVSVVVDDDGSSVGGIVGERFPGSEVLLVAYIAVHPAHRGGGVGSQIAREVLPTWTAALAAPLVVGEVHDPRVWPTAGDEDPVARMRFYGRLGARLLDLAFVQPALEPGGARVRGFLLIAFHADPSIRTRRAGREHVSAALVTDFVAAYYAVAEGLGSPDAELRGMLDSLRGRSGVALLGLDEYVDIPLPGGDAPGGPSAD
jgi:GNAT superfamily N-acetyltransferase